MCVAFVAQHREMNRAIKEHLDGARKVQHLHQLDRILRQ